MSRDNTPPARTGATTKRYSPRSGYLSLVTTVNVGPPSNSVVTSHERDCTQKPDRAAAKAMATH